MITATGTGASTARLVLAAAMIATVVVTLDVSVVNIAIPQFEQTFGIGADAAQWVLNAYTLTFASLLLNAGALIDRWGTRRTFLAGFAGFTAASLGCGVASGWTALLVARACQGVGAALLIPSALAMIQRGIPDPAARAQAIGWWAASGSTALAAGPVVGGALVELFGWRSIFLVNLPIGVAGMGLAWRCLPRQRRNDRSRPDVAGQLLAIGMLACVVLAVSESGRKGLTSAAVAGLGSAAVILAGVLVAVERRVHTPMLPPALLAQGGFMAAVAAGAVINFVFYGLVFVLSVYLQGAQHRDAFGAGLAMAPMMAVLVAVNAAAGWLDTHLGARRTIMTGLFLVAVGCGATAAAAGSPTLLPLLPGLLLIGAGTAMTVPAIATTAIAGVPLQSGGIASGVLNAARQVGGALGVALFGSILGVLGNVTATLRMASVVAALAAFLPVAVAFAADFRKPG